MKGYRDNGGGGGGFGARSKTVYDDVFGGPPKFGATTLPPRLEDYTEIFQGFHASRGSSIPVLDLPPAAGDSDEVWFDVRSSKLDYSEVFGGFNGLDFAVSYEELFKSSKVGDDDSSDDVWTPAQSESLSDESDPNQLFGLKSQNDPCLEEDKDLLNELTNDLQIPDLPSKIEDDNFISLDNNDLCATSKDICEGKKLNKSFSQPLERYASDPSSLSGNLKGYFGNKPVFSVSDLGLKTQPCHLPPPSRPPPSITSKKGDFNNFNSKLKTSKSYAFERMAAGDRSPPYFDVEIDSSSSAAAAMKDAVEQAQAKLKSAKELMDKKKDKKGRINDGFSSVTKHEVKQKNEKDSVLEETEDCKIVQERETEKRLFVGQQDEEIRAPNDSDENENLIEIQLKDNDVEKVVTENWLKDNVWEDYEVGFEENENELKETDEKEKQSEEERIVKDSFELEESDDVAEIGIVETKKEQTLDHNLQEEEEKKEKDSNSEENIKLAECESEEIISENNEIESEQEGIKWDEIENESVTEEKSDNEILEASRNLQEENEKVEETVDQLVEESYPDFQGVKVEIKTQDFTDTNLSNENATIEDEKKTCEINKNKEKDAENEGLRKLEEERERQIEREKDRMAVDRATLEARERAFGDTKERTERAAVERATAEFRQRALAEARERLEKACAEARERSLAEKANEGRLRVEKATAEARERAAGFNYQNSGIRQNSDLGRSYSGLRYSQTAVQSGGEGESPQRCKARLERHQRTADRAAKALAEKNMRDLIAQKEQAERSRLAESVDAEVKRWSNGKQGNLRALLSTLQYILGSDSGWQPVPLTEVITSAAVKKAYRKATLCVHPDKLQQRGATIQQKYICEKVFDLLKEAWNKFNSEER